MKPAADPRALELLAERAIRPLDDSEHWELNQLGAEDDDSFDLAAAALATAVTPIEPLPAHLAEKIFSSSPGAMMLPGNLRTIPGVAPARPIVTHTPEVAVPGPELAVPAPAPAPDARPAPTDIERMREKKRSRAATVIPWVAAAACLALAIGAVLWARDQARSVQPVVVNNPPPDAMTQAPKELTLSEQRDQLLANAADVTKLEWTATTDPTAVGAKGDVVWSASEQRGYMRFVGLAPNDIQQFQYQLWIFDKNRDDKYPVDGGVFDVTSTGEVIVPISAKLPVSEVALFAVTVEKPGGVVVSSRERIVVTAARKT